jgi:hypothetical protein
VAGRPLLAFEAGGGRPAAILVRHYPPPKRNATREYASTFEVFAIMRAEMRPALIVPYAT